ncbi:MAG: MTH1187 family thiamine-binding protein [Nitrososphaera sp.]
MTVHAEISIIPIAKGHDPGMSKEVAAAFDAIRKVPGIRATLTALGTQIEASSFDDVLKAIKAAHDAARSAGADRVISTIRIDERHDKSQTLQDKIQSVEQKLKGSK